MAVQNQLSFNKLLETQIVQLALALSHPYGGGFLGQSATLVKENVKAVITQSGKTMSKPKANPKKTAPIEPNDFGSGMRSRPPSIANSLSTQLHSM
jgi:hypothetical protein